MSIKKMKDVTAPILEKQTLFQLNQLKIFIDTTIKRSVTETFENDSEKLTYLLSTLYDIRDFVLTQTTENSVRINLLNQFRQIEEEELLGNSSSEQEKSSLTQAEESSEQSQNQLEKEEEKLESTANG
tara:strand:+ start:382 stop:765 length:384 start_codon:yes stop_codon:yes gene_type:complete